MRKALGMVGRQARFMGRTVREVIRDPAVGADLGRLVRTRGRSTARLRVPWLPFALIDLLEERVRPGTRVFEYGGGGSTLWFLDRGAEVVTVEHHAEWAARLATLASSDRWTLLTPPGDEMFGAYVGAIDQYPTDHFDIVVVDGRERVRCAQRARSHVRPGGWLIFDDVDRRRYRSGLGEIPWPRRDVVGFAPAKPSLGYSAVFTRPGNDE